MGKLVIVAISLILLTESLDRKCGILGNWPAMPRMKSMRPAIAERLDNPDVNVHSGPK